MAEFDPVSYMMGQKAAGGGGGSSTLSGLTDVDISSPTNGQTLVYNATSGKWENGAGGGSGGSVFLIHADEQTMVLDKTAKEILDAINAGKSIVAYSVIDGTSHFYFLFTGYSASPGNGYSFNFVMFNSEGFEYVVFETDTENGYPVYLPQ